MHHLCYDRPLFCTGEQHNLPDGLHRSDMHDATRRSVFLIWNNPNCVPKIEVWVAGAAKAADWLRVESLLRLRPLLSSSALSNEAISWGGKGTKFASGNKKRKQKKDSPTGNCSSFRVMKPQHAKTVSFGSPTFKDSQFLPVNPSYLQETMNLMDAKVKSICSRFDFGNDRFVNLVSYGSK